MKNIVITQPIGFSEAQIAELKTLGNLTVYDTICKDTDASTMTPTKNCSNIPILLSHHT